MAAQPKGSPAKPKAPPEEHPKWSKAEDPKELSQKKKEKAHEKSPPKKNNKGKGKKKVDKKPKRVHYKVEGKPHRKMPATASRGENYQARPAYDNDVQVMQCTLEMEYNVSLRRVCQHYKVCLAEDRSTRRELSPALLLVSEVRAYSVQMILRCATRNAQRRAAARQLFEEPYRSTTPRQIATGLIKVVSVCMNCVGASDCATDFVDPLVGGVLLSKLKREPPSVGFRARRSDDQLSAFGAEDIVAMATDVL